MPVNSKSVLKTIANNHMQLKLTGSIFFILILLSGCEVRNNENKVAAAVLTAKKERPNVIIIIVDDAGYVDFGFMGSQDLPTPEIDKLAKSGTILTDAHVTATVCAPSRAGLMTGQYQQRTGFEANGTGGIGLDDQSITIADIFKTNGYRTYALGKWHLGEDDSDHPNNRGFDEFYGFIDGGRSYFPLKKPSPTKMLQHNGKRVLFEGYMTDVLGIQAAKFANESANKKEPFFMYLSFNAVHTPMEAKEEDLKRFEGHPRQTLAAMTWSLDENVGRLRNALAETGELENTLIFFLSDNGGAHSNTSDNGELKGWKGNKFEGGHRVPFLVSWPGVLENDQHFDGLTSSLDIFMTSIAAAGIEAPSQHILDGVNILPYLSGDKTGDPHKALYWRKLEESAIRMGDYKWISLDNYGSVLYNLADDLGESNDLKEQRPEINEKLMKSFDTWHEDMIDPLWDEGESWMSVTRHIHKSLMQNKETDYKDPHGRRNFKTSGSD